MVWENMAVTDNLGLKAGGVNLYGARNAAVDVAGLVGGTDVAGLTSGFPTVGRFVLRRGWLGMEIGGVGFTGMEAAILTAAGIGVEFVFTWPAWEAGVFVGSVANVAFTGPCSYGP
jgi:hypothetical protein